MLAEEVVSLICKPEDVLTVTREVKYVVYSTGRIYSIHKQKDLKQEINFGYHRVNIASTHVRVHRLVAYLYCQNPSGYNVVNHIDGNKSNNHYTNLEWCTAEHNEKHSLDTGLKPQGESHYLATFTEAQLRECLNNSNFSPTMRFKDFKQILKPLNITTDQARHLFDGSSWYSVTKDYGIIKRSDLAIEDRPAPNRSIKLYKEQVYEIHKLLFEGKSDTEISTIYSVTNTTIGKIRSGKLWTHIKPKQPFPNVNGRQALTKEQLKSIQYRLTFGTPGSVIANEFNISTSLVSQIKQNKLPSYLT